MQDIAVLFVGDVGGYLDGVRTADIYRNTRDFGSAGNGHPCVSRHNEH